MIERLGPDSMLRTRSPSAPLGCVLAFVLVGCAASGAAPPSSTTGATSSTAESPWGPTAAPGAGSASASTSTSASGSPSPSVDDASLPEESLGPRAQAQGPHYKVVAVLAGGCKVGDECRVRVRLTSLDGYRISTSYPLRLEVRDATLIEAASAGGGAPDAGKPTFSKATGDFALDAAHPDVGVMTARFRANKNGTATATVLFYLAVETDKETTIGRPMLNLIMPVK
jgi:hypothetical protein